MLLFLACLTPSPVAAAPAAAPVQPVPAPPSPSVLPTSQPEPPRGSLTARMAWLAEHAPLTIPREGCAWLPAAPGCARPAWICVVPWSQYGSGGGTFGANATFGHDPAVKAAWTGEEPPRDEDIALGHTSSDGARLAIKVGEEAFGAPVYEWCIRTFEDAHPCDAACQAAGWPGHAAAADRCTAEAKAIAGETLATCTVVLADACTSHVGLRCEGGRYHTVPVTMDPADPE